MKNNIDLILTTIGIVGVLLGCIGFAMRVFADNSIPFEVKFILGSLLLFAFGVISYLLNFIRK